MQMKESSGATPRGVVALGASAGGIEALQRSVAALPVDFPLAVVVVLHIPAASRSLLADIIARQTSLSVSAAGDGEPLRGGHIFVAPPDHHLLVTPDALALDRGPKENGARPAIDPLFRSLAASWGPRGIAVVLSGALADGAAGAAAVAAAGGAVIVQAPQDAVVPSMPDAALRAVPTAGVFDAEHIGAALVARAEGLAHGVDNSPAHDKEAIVPPESFRPSTRAKRPAWPPSGLTCPECHGPLWEESTHGVVQFRCRVGHAYNEEVLLEAKGGEVEAAMWSAVEALEEHAELIRKVAVRMDRSGRDHAGALLRRRADRSDERADVLRGVLEAAGHPEPQPEAA
jgi:two-component system, chemotaxis family, protein-glutamate methylesterase/glutaminase